MIKYDFYKKYDDNGRGYLEVNKHSVCRARDKVISDKNEYYDIVRRFLSQGFDVELNGDTLVLKNNSTLFNLNGYKSYFDSDYLKEIREYIESKVDLAELEFQQRMKELEERRRVAALNKKGFVKRVGKRVAAFISATSLAMGISHAVFMKQNEEIGGVDDSLDDVSSCVQVIDDGYLSAVDESPTISFEVCDEAYAEELDSELVEDSIDMMASLGVNDSIEESLSEVDEFENYVRLFSIYYHFDGDKVVEFVRHATNNYEVDFRDIINTFCDIARPESAAMVLCNKIFAGKYKSDGYPSSYFKTGDYVEVMDESHLLRNGLRFTDFYGYVSDMIGSQKDYSLAICYLESGRLTSKLTYTKNNFGGLGEQVII